MPTLKTVTLGCKVNQYETEYIRGGLAGLGYREAANDQPADLYLVNTCTVTGEADLKSRKAIRQIARQNPRAEIIVMGCYATRAADEVAALPGVVEVITDKRELPELLARLGVVDVPDGIASFGRRHRAYVKVQDGCRMPCSYCIIPKVRPELISRPADEVLAEVGRLVEQGYREVVLTGIHLGHYGVDLGKKGADAKEEALALRGKDLECRRPHPAAAPPPSPGGRGEELRPRDLAGLIRRILSIGGEFRLRISSIEAVEVTDELVELMAAEPARICPHLHVSMQSGSDAVLERMQRRWASGRFVEKCRQVQRALDEPALTTDVIVGFPGETKADFEATCRVVEEVGFSKLHVFRFSPRQGTPAAEMPDRVPGAEMQRRAAALARIGNRLREQYLQQLVGRRLQVLVEKAAPRQPGTLVGTACRYVPVELPGMPDGVGRLVQVTAESTAAGRIQASPAG